MTTIACDGKSMAGDGLVVDHFDTIIDTARAKVRRLLDGRIVGGAGNVADLEIWANWLNCDQYGDWPIKDERFAGLILETDGRVLWVDHLGREIPTPPPCAVGSGQDYAYGAMAAGATPFDAVIIASKRDPRTGGAISMECLV